MGNISLATTASLKSLGGVGGGGGGGPGAIVGLFAQLNNIQIHQESSAVDLEVYTNNPAPFGSTVPPFSNYPAVSTPTNINYAEDTPANRLLTPNNILYPVYNLGGIGDPSQVYPQIFSGNYTDTLVGYYNFYLDIDVSGLTINIKGANMWYLEIGWEVDIGSFSSGLINILDIPFFVFQNGSGGMFPELAQLSSQNAMANRYFTVVCFPVNQNPTVTFYNNLIMAGLHSPKFPDYMPDYSQGSNIGNPQFAIGLGYTQPQAPNINAWAYDGTSIHGQTGQTGFISITTLTIHDNSPNAPVATYDILANQFNGNNIYIPIQMG